MGILKLNGVDYATGGGSGDASHSYSTEEQVVGTWIDGSTVYEKIIHASNLSGYTIDWTSIGNISGIAQVVSLEGVANCNNNKQFQVNHYIRLIYDESTSNVCYFCQDFGGITINDLYVTIRYTKSTT